MSDNKKRMDKDTKGCLAMIVALFVFLYGGMAIEMHVAEKKQQRRDAYQEQRRIGFATYVIEYTKNWVAQNMDTTKINKMAKEYRANPVEYDAKMVTLAADSTKCADSIFYNARAIKNMGDTISFEAAMVNVDSQQSMKPVVKTKKIYVPEHVGFGDFIIIEDEVPVCTVMEPNYSFEWYLKNNKKHLQDISLDLATRRAAKTR